MSGGHYGPGFLTGLPQTIELVLERKPGGLTDASQSRFYPRRLPAMLESFFTGRDKFRAESCNLLGNGCVYSEFLSFRRFDHEWIPTGISGGRPSPTGQFYSSRQFETQAKTLRFLYRVTNGSRSKDREFVYYDHPQASRL
jgi:hypothetical protein